MKRKINEIIVHCTATPRGRDIGAAEVRRHHVDTLHWSDIGYHYIVRLDGTVETGRSEEIAGAHCLGHNRNSIGIAYVGGVEADNSPADTRTEAQKKALANLLADLAGRFPGAQIHSHRDFAAKACPSFDATAEYRHLWRKIAMMAIAAVSLLSSCRTEKSAASAVRSERSEIAAIHRSDNHLKTAAASLRVDFDSIVLADSIRRVAMYKPRIKSERATVETSASEITDSIYTEVAATTEIKSESQRSAGSTSLLQLVYGLSLFASGFAVRHFLSSAG